MQSERKPPGAQGGPDDPVPDAGGATGPVRARILAVGDLASALATDITRPEDVVCLPFAEIDAAALARIRPEVVISLMVGPGFDCIDVAERLTEAGFRGTFRAVAPRVPDKGMVQREISDRFPGLDFDLVMVKTPG